VDQFLAIRTTATIASRASSAKVSVRGATKPGAVVVEGVVVGSVLFEPSMAVVDPSSPPVTFATLLLVVVAAVVVTAAVVVVGGVVVGTVDVTVRRITHTHTHTHAHPLIYTLSIGGVTYTFLH